MTEPSTATDTAETTVLFVDDEPELLEMYELLCGSEYAVLTARTGDEALDMFGDHVDMAFFDRRMPDASGEELIEAVRSEGHDTSVGIISAVDPDRSPDIERDVYLTKPVTRTELLETIRQHTA